MLRVYAVWAVEQPRLGVWLSILAENPRLRQNCFPGISAKTSSTRAAPASKGLARGFAANVNAEFGGHRRVSA